MLLGLIAVALPFIGIPAAAKTVLLIVVGVATMILGLLVREERRLLIRALSGDTTDAYTENGSTHYAEAVEKAS